MQWLLRDGSVWPNMPQLCSQGVLLCAVLGIQPSGCEKGKIVFSGGVDLLPQKCAGQTENGGNMRSHEILSGIWRRIILSVGGDESTAWQSLLSSTSYSDKEQTQCQNGSY